MTKNDQTPSGKVIRTRWLSPRRKRFWAIILLLAYTLFGFFAMPPLLHKTALSFLQDDLGRATSIANIRFNPIALSLRIQGFEMHDTDGARLAAFDEFYANFQWTSLLKWAWTFSDVQLHRPYFHIERFNNGETNIGRLLNDLDTLKPDRPDARPEPELNVPRVLFRNLVIENGTVNAVDGLPTRPVDIQLAPINIAMQELSTIPDKHGQKTITIRLPGNASIEWAGSVALKPLAASGELVLDSLQLEPFTAYLESLLPLESISARLSSRFNYSLQSAADGTLNLDLDNLGVVLNDIRVLGLEPATEFVVFSEIALHCLQRMPSRKGSPEAGTLR